MIVDKSERIDIAVEAEFEEYEPSEPGGYFTTYAIFLICIINIIVSIYYIYVRGQYESDLGKDALVALFLIVSIFISIICIHIRCIKMGDA
jgi:hypothetical protein